ncbi:hypothetical protein HDV00_012667 [Rhizophlyctis rosea]|nr:hypothetical protein HDV00_012667 [Rhizophlyctis rosea]
MDLPTEAELEPEWTEGDDLVQEEEEEDLFLQEDDADVDTWQGDLGSQFFLNEQRRDEATTRRVAELMQKVDALRGTDLSFEKKVVEEKLRTIEGTRDLGRWIVHVDMDAFYASVEELDRPELKEKPMGVGVDTILPEWMCPKFGVRSAMPGYIALKLCPDLILVKPNFQKYTHYSKLVREVFAIYDPNFSPMSLDEAYLDLTDYLQSHPERTPEEVVQEIRSEIESRTKLTASAGIAANKMLAKVCSDVNKPNGQKLIPQSRDAILEYISTLPIRKVPGIGRVTERILKALGVEVCGDLGKHLVIIYKLFSPIMFEFLARVSLGLGSTEVESEWDRKSMGCERTFRTISDPTALYDKLYEIAVHLAQDLEKEKLKGRTLTLKLKGSDFRVYSRAKTVNRMIWTAGDLFSYGKQILAGEIAAHGGLKLRLMGLRMTGLASREAGEGGIAKFLKRPVSNGEEGEGGEGEGEEGGGGKRARHDESEAEATPCPVCGRPLVGMSAHQLSLHVDRCLEGPKVVVGSNTSGASSTPQVRDDSRGKRKSGSKTGKGVEGNGLLDWARKTSNDMNNDSTGSEGGNGTAKRVATCPICNEAIEGAKGPNDLQRINAHVDRCLGPTEMPSSPLQPPSSPLPGSSSPLPPPSSPMPSPTDIPSPSFTAIQTGTHKPSYHTFDKCEIPFLQTSLLRWYDINQRLMPWRAPCGVGGCVVGGEKGEGGEGMTEEEAGQRAYEVWVSEVMLQQTQVATVVSYYEKWMKKFPTIFDLAGADEETVTQLWAGLGYYSRAKRLHQAAKLVVKERKGILPRSAELLEKEVPGVGAYTAGAIASIAYNLPAPLVDGNVVRVLSRLRAVGGDPKKKEVVSLHWKLAKDILSHSRPGHFNQALMDLGATVCTPVGPKCGECPVSRVCHAFAEQEAVKLIATESLLGKRRKGDEGKEDDEVTQCQLCVPVPDIEDGSVTRYPIKVEKKAVRTEDRAVCVVEWRQDEGSSRFLVVKGPEKGLLANLWDFPNVELPATSTSSAPDASPSPAAKTKSNSKLAKKPLPTPSTTTPTATLPYTTRKTHMDAYFLQTGLQAQLAGMKEVRRRDAGECVHLFSHVRRRMLVEVVVVKGDVTETTTASVKGKGKTLERKVVDDEDAVVGDRGWKWLTKEELVGPDAVVGVPATLKKALAIVDKVKGKKSNGLDDREDEEWVETGNGKKRKDLSGGSKTPAGKKKKGSKSGASADSEGRQRRLDGFFGKRADG